MVRRTGQLSINGHLSRAMRSHCVSRDRELEVSWTRSGFRVKCITYLHDDLTHNYNLLFQDPDSVPNWLSQGTTTLIPKNDNTDQAKNTSLSCV